MALANVKKLAEILPANVYVQSIGIEACRTTGIDKQLPGTAMFPVKQSYGLYIPNRRLLFSTPIWAPPNCQNWADFLNELETADSFCLNYRYDDATETHVDLPFSDRLYIKDLLLLEIDANDPRYHSPPYYAYVTPDGTEDSFYDGIRCSFIQFSGQTAMVGHVAVGMRNGWMPGETRIPMDVIEIRVTKTKHTRGNIKYKSYMAFSRDKDDIHIESCDQIVNHPDRVSIWARSCCENRIIEQRKEEGKEEYLKRFRPEFLDIDEISVIQPESENNGDKFI